VKVKLNTVFLLSGIGCVLLALGQWSCMTKMGHLIPPSRRDKAFAFALPLVSPEGESVPPDTSVDPVPPDTSVEPVPPETSVQPPPAADDGLWRLADQKGNAVFVIFWASWSEDCVGKDRGLDVAAKLHDVFASQGIVFIAVNNRQNLDAIADCAALLRQPYPCLLDVKGVACNGFDIQGRPQDAPTCLAIDAQGRIAAHFFGFSKEFEALATVVLEALVVEGQAP